VSTEPRTIPPAEASPEAPAGNGESPEPLGVREEKPSGWAIWLCRIRALLFVTVCATLGVLLIILPWTPRWTDSPLLLNSPLLRESISSGFVRGLVSGLGVLDLWLGFWEAIHYHESPKSSA
jgi:hypothetical protein